MSTTGHIMCFLRCFIFFFILVSPSFSQKPPRVIIIGAGPSGTAAATRLLENNITDLVILEAEGRIGGRIHSVKFGDAFIDLGAHWCHGEEDNIVYALVKDLDILETTITKPIAWYSSTGRLDDTFNEELYEAIGNAFDARTKGVKDSVRDFYTANYIESVLEKFKHNRRNLRLSLPALRLLEQFILAHRGSFSLSTVIVERDYKVCEGDLRLNWNGLGYKTILEVMIKNTPFYEKLKLEKHVKKIHWDLSEETGVKVETIDGDVFEGDHVVFTGSVGVLKHDHEELFNPSLPEVKKEVINEIGLDAIVDASLHFEKKWWSEEEEYFLIWEEDDAIAEIENIAKYGKWIFDIFNLTPNPKNPNVLTVWIVGPSVPEVEKLTNEEFTAGVMFVIRKFFKNVTNVTNPIDVIRSQWYSNPHFRGTYSYQTQKAFDRRPSAEVELSKPLKNGRDEVTLLFAGEATHPHYYSTVHGAIETGYREADRILEFVKNQK